MLTGKTDQIITLSVFGALTLYAIPMGLALLCLASMAYYDASVGLIYLGLLGAGYAWFFVIPKSAREGFASRGDPELSAERS